MFVKLLFLLFAASLQDVNAEGDQSYSCPNSDHSITVVDATAIVHVCEKDPCTEADAIFSYQLKNQGPAAAAADPAEPPAFTGATLAAADDTGKIVATFAEPIVGNVAVTLICTKDGDANVGSVTIVATHTGTFVEATPQIVLTSTITSSSLPTDAANPATLTNEKGTIEVATGGTGAVDATVAFADGVNTYTSRNDITADDAALTQTVTFKAPASADMPDPPDGKDPEKTPAPGDNSQTTGGDGKGATEDDGGNGGNGGKTDPSSTTTADASSLKMCPVMVGLLGAVAAAM